MIRAAEKGFNKWRRRTSFHDVDLPLSDLPETTTEETMVGV